MSSDFGDRRRRAPRRSPQVWLVLVATIGLCGAVVGTVLLRNRDQQMAEARALAIDGPPCAALTEAAFGAARLTAPRTFVYDQLHFGRAAGHVSCSQVGENGGTAFGAVTVCQFTSPAALTVRTPKGAWFFSPGVGHPATVFVDKDVPRCVLASKFRF
jgi:hypothetical protein